VNFLFFDMCLLVSAAKVKGCAFLSGFAFFLVVKILKRSGVT